MTGAIECRYYGRDFTAEEMALLVTTVNFPFVTTQNFSLWACR